MRVLPVDEQLVRGAKALPVAEREMAVSAETLFATLADGPSWSKWVPVIREVSWTSPKPFRVGTTRTVTLTGGIKVDEVFWTWEPNRRMGFAAEGINVGWVAALAEVYEIEPLGAQRCRLRWTFAVSLSGALGKMRPVVEWVLSTVQPHLLKKLERIA